jgi:8-O-methyltransferase
MDLSIDYWKSRAFLAAVELGVFRELGSDGLAESVLAERLKLRPQGLKILLGVLKSLGLVEDRPETGEVLNTPLSQMYLNPDSPACMAGSFMYAREMFPLWHELEARLKDGASMGKTPTKKDTPTFLKGMHDRAMMLAHKLLPLLSISDKERVLDVAAGAGTWSWLLQKAGKGASFTLVEQPELCSDMSDFIADCGLRDFDAVPQDYHELELSETYEHVLYFGALHQESPEEMGQVLSRCYDFVKPGGALWVLDIFATGTTQEDLFSWLFGLNMLLTTDGGVFELDQVEETIRGFAELGELKSHRVPVDLPYYLLEVRRA